MIDAAIVGLGWWGRQHVESIAGSTLLRYIRAVSKEPDQVRPFADRHGLALGTEYEEVLADPAVEAVVLCTPHLFHPQQVVAAAQAGKHVYCEKPLSLTRAGAVLAVDACRSAGVVLAVGHDKRLNPGFVAFREAVASGEIGPILSVESNANRDTVDVSPGSWKTMGDNAGSLGLLNYGVHRIDALVSVFGPVRRVFASRAAGMVPDSPGIDATAVILEFESGVLGYLGTLSRSAPFSRFQAFSPEGSVLLREWNEVHRTLRGAAPVMNGYPDIDTVCANVELFAKAVREGGGFHIPAHEMIATAAVVEACLASLRTEMPVMVGRLPAAGSRM
ncbi:MAG: gfo/Idh/MocA family oxidoreductase [Ramlibacter sp.]|nr:gfo/Idh/MocA family oxidoreductase [Ramlibacter sp.]